MKALTSRKSWDTTVKHYYRLGLEGGLPKEMQNLVSKSSISRWKNEPENKYIGCEITTVVKQDLELIKKIIRSKNIKKINKSYFKLSQTLSTIIKDVKSIKSIFKNHKEAIVNTIEAVKDYIPINDALLLFNISRSTYQNYKSIIIHKCEASYFKWCTKRYPNQLLAKEVETIKKYMVDTRYKYWSKSSVYLRAIRDEALLCGLSTFYKYCRLLGYKNVKRFDKIKNREPLRTHKPNQVWCADVTIFKTKDHVKHYIHVLMDHYSKKIIGYSIENSSSGKAIRQLLHNAYIKHKPQNTLFLTDGGSENVNSYVSNLLNSWNNTIIHRIAQRDVVFSNSMIEAFNKTLKYEFLHPQDIPNGKKLKHIVNKSIVTYNNHRPQQSLEGNTPNETFNGIVIDFKKYTTTFNTQKIFRLTQNKQNACKVCL